MNFKKFRPVAQKKFEKIQLNFFQAAKKEKKFRFKKKKKNFVSKKRKKISFKKKKKIVGEIFFNKKGC